MGLHVSKGGPNRILNRQATSCQLFFFSPDYATASAKPSPGNERKAFLEGLLRPDP